MRRRFIPAILLALSLVLPACTSFGANLYAGYAEMTFSGDLALTSTQVGGVPATVSQDVESAMGLGEPQGSPYVRAEFALGLPRLTFSAFTFSEEGVGVLVDDFGDVPAGSQVITALDFNNFKGALTFDIDLSVLRLSPGIGVDVFDMNLRVADVTATVEEDIDVLAPVPMIFVQGELDLDLIKATVDVGGMSISTDEFGGDFFDVEAMLRVNPVGGLELFGGYRYIAIQADGSTDTEVFGADLQLDGWFVGGGYVF